MMNFIRACCEWNALALIEAAARNAVRTIAYSRFLAPKIQNL